MLPAVTHLNHCGHFDIRENSIPLELESESGMHFGRILRVYI